MSLNKPSLSNNSSDTNWNNYNFIDYFDIKKNDISNLPTGVKISTISCSCKDGLGTNVDLTNILKYMTLKYKTGIFVYHYDFHSLGLYII